MRFSDLKGKTELLDLLVSSQRQRDNWLLQFDVSQRSVALHFGVVETTAQDHCYLVSVHLSAASFHIFCHYLLTLRDLDE